jgi:hypothetical protein
MLFRERVAVYCENHTEHANTLCGQNAEFSMLQQVVHIVTTGLRRVNEVDADIFQLHCKLLPRNHRHQV